MLVPEKHQAFHRPASLPAMLKRTLLSKLLEWKQRAARQPVLLNGARQTGKTFLLQNIFYEAGKFRRLHYLDFERDPSLESIFDDGLGASSVVTNISLRLGESVDLDQDLIVLDEVGACGKALQSLKYFSEELPHACVIATGSNISLLESFPVGKVEMMDLFPLTFAEFLEATASSAVVKAFAEALDTSELHRQLWSALLDYFYVGGMPDAVNRWLASDLSLLRRVQHVNRMHRSLIDGYLRDFGKYSGPVNAQHLESVFRNVPAQLGKNIDQSVRRFRFREAIAGKRRYAELSGPIDWLVKAKLVSRNYPIARQPKPPLHIQSQENFFKLFLLDVGLLGNLAGMSYEDHRHQKTEFKGFIAENFVQNELIARGLDPTYSWEQNQAQIEFVIRNSRGDVVPVEVKSGKRTQAKSLASYIHRYRPRLAIKLIAACGGQHETLRTAPLYYASKLLELVDAD